VSGGLALLRVFCQWMIEHQIRKCCVKGVILRNMAGRERVQAVFMKVITMN